MPASEKKYSFRFVCQGGGIDIKSAFLAASLTKNLRCDYELIACVPEGDGVEQPDVEILSFLRDIGVSIHSISNPLAADYPIGNKLACLEIESSRAKHVFLDSDILCLRPFHGFPENESCQLMAKLEDWNHHSDHEWAQLYSHLELGKPDMCFRSTVLNQVMPLYFNAGVIVVDHNSDIPGNWIKIAKIVDSQLDLPRQRPNLDQLSLAAMVIQYEYKWQLLDENYNYPGELRSLNHSRLPYLCHYHDPIMVLADAYMSGFISRLCLKYSKLQNIAKNNHQWVWQLACEERIQALCP